LGLKSWTKIAGLSLAGMIAACGALRAQEWPAREIKLVAPFGPIGFVDVVARVISDELAQELGKPVIVENRAGAGGALGAGQVARAPADGYTLLLGGLAPNIMSPAINTNVTYDGLRDFTHIAYIGGPPVAWIVPKDSPLKTVRDVIEEARKDRLVGYNSSGVGTLGHVLVAMVTRQANVKIPHVPMNQASMMDIIAGRVPLGSFAYGSVVGQIQGGAARMISVSSEQRVAAFPDVPTFKDSGFDVAANSWLSLEAPKGLPQPIADRLRAAIGKILQKPNVAERLRAEGIAPKPMSPAELSAFFESEAARWIPAAKDAVSGE